MKLYKGYVIYSPYILIEGEYMESKESIRKKHRNRVLTFLLVSIFSVIILLSNPEISYVLLPTTIICSLITLQDIISYLHKYHNK